MSRTTGEYALRITISAISSATDANAFLITSSVRGSVASRSRSAAQSTSMLMLPKASSAARAAGRDDGGRVVLVDEQRAVDLDALESCPADRRNVEESDVRAEVGAAGDRLPVGRPFSTGAESAASASADRRAPRIRIDTRSTGSSVDPCP